MSKESTYPVKIKITRNKKGSYDISGSISGEIIKDNWSLFNGTVEFKEGYRDNDQLLTGKINKDSLDSLIILIQRVI